MEENADSFSNLEENLRSRSESLDNLPYILQFNKRDLPNVAPVHYMDFLLNRRENARAVLRSGGASQGEGVWSR